MKVLVCGTRSCPPRLERALIARLDRWLAVTRDEWVPHLVHGGCTGVDAYAAAWVKGKLGDVIEHAVPADWSRGLRAGPERNQRMLDEHQDIKLVLAFHTEMGLGKGTADMVRRALAKGLPVEVHLRT